MAKRNKIIVDEIFHQDFRHIHKPDTDRFLQGLMKRNAKFIAEQNKKSGLIIPKK